MRYGEDAPGAAEAAAGVMATNREVAMHVQCNH